MGWTRYQSALLLVLSSVAAGASTPPVCRPSPAIAEELKRAGSSQLVGAAYFEQNVAPFRALRDRHPDNLFAHEAYQDAVQRFGIEGWLRALIEEYLDFSIQHSGNVIYRYLYNRSLIGRNTASAIRGMNEVLTEQPDFAPAHRSLAEIYAMEAFRDEEKEAIERKKFAGLCPGSAPALRPPPLPEPSPLLEHAEQLLAENGDPEHAAAMALQGVRDDEWRLQRIRPFDWYSADFKRRSQAELQAKYWRLWSLQVRCYRKAGQAGKASDLLATMEQRAVLLRSRADAAYWDALAALVRLYAEGNEKERAREKLNSMQQLLALRPDPQRTSEFEKLRGLIQGPER